MVFQYTFPFAIEDEFGEFINTEANQIVVDFFKIWPEWGDTPFSNILFLQGPARSGKTHLLVKWQNVFQASFIQLSSSLENLHNNNVFYLEDLDTNLNVEQEKLLLHIINYINETKRYLIITSRSKLSEFNCNLLDLASRMKAINYLEIKNCDDNLFSILLYKHLVKYNLRPNKEVIRYIEQRLERSYEIVEEFTCKLNEISLKEMKKPSVYLVKKIMESM